MSKEFNSGLWPSHLLGQISGDLPVLTYPQAAKYVRNQLRQYSARSVVQIAIQRLSTDDYRNVEHLQTWPWLSCLIVKLALEDEELKLDGPPCPEQVFNRCLSALWSAQGGRDRLSPDKNIWLQIRAMLAAQLAFQRPPRWDFLRFPALIDRLTPDHPSRIQFIEMFGMEPHVFMCISFAILAGVIGGQKSLSLAQYKQFTDYFGDTVSRVFDEFGRDLVGLRTQLVAERVERKTAGVEIRPAYEYNEEPWLQRFPLLRTDPTTFLVWHPAVFTRGFETAVHRKMSTRAEHHANSFSKVFEAYVMELLKNSNTDFFGEDDYKQLAGSDSKAVEAIITQDGANIFIEAKLTKYSETVNISGEAGRVWMGMKRILEAMHQGWEVASALRDKFADHDQWRHATENYLLIVTSQPMACASGEHFRRWFGQDVFDPERQRAKKKVVPNSAQLDLLPPKHIVVASIDEYEHLMDAVKRGEIRLPTMFREIAAQIASPETSFMFFEQFLADNYGVSSGSPVVIQKLDAIYETLASCFNEDPSVFRQNV